MSWILLFAAGMAEIVFALSLKYNHVFTRLWPGVVTVMSGAASFYLLMLALKTLPVGTAYAVWTGIGAVGVAIVGILFLGESTNVFRLLSLALVIAGIVGLKLSHME